MCLKIDFPGRPIFIQLTPVHNLREAGDPGVPGVQRGARRRGTPRQVEDNVSISGIPCGFLCIGSLEPACKVSVLAKGS